MSESLSDDGELLYRQVHPSFVTRRAAHQPGVRPTPKDEGRLSVARGSLTTEKAAYEHSHGARWASAPRGRGASPSASAGSKASQRGPIL